MGEHRWRYSNPLVAELHSGSLSTAVALTIKLLDAAPLTKGRKNTAYVVHVLGLL